MFHHNLPSERPPFDRHGAIAIGLCFIVILVVGCSRPANATVVTANDQQVATEAAQFLEQALKNLPDDHPLVERYGKYVSMTTTPVQRNPMSKAALGEGGFPAHLQIECHCTCEKFPATITMTIVNYGANAAIQFLNPEQPFSIAPIPEVVKTGALSDCKPVLRDGELWYVREGGDQTEIRCMVGCIVQHPKFVP